MARIFYLTQIELDFGAVRCLPQECDNAGMRRPLLVTDAGVRAAGVFDRVLAALGDRAHAVFDQTPSNPTEAAVRAAVDVFRASKCDGLIAIGGGSSIDLAKGVAIAATHPGALKTYATIEGGSAKITAAVAPLIALVVRSFGKRMRQLTRDNQASMGQVTGDLTQVDLPYHRKSGLLEASEILREVEGISFVFFDEKDAYKLSKVAKYHTEPITAILVIPPTGPDGGLLSASGTGVPHEGGSEESRRKKADLRNTNRISGCIIRASLRDKAKPITIQS